MKKHLALVLLVALPLGLMGCGSDKSDEGDKQQAPAQTPAK
ncbi:MAG: hypothetical protein WCI75_17445 [candidate division NC10 bacterium]